MENKEAIALLNKYRAGTCSEAEIATLESWYLEWNAEPQAVDEATLATLKEEMWAAMPKAAPKTKTLWPRIAAIAAAVAAITVGIWFYTSRPIVNRNPQIVTQNDIAPGKNMATLTMGNGKVYQLSDAKTGVVVDASSLKYDDGTAVERRDAAADKDSNAAANLTITTPKGGQYQVRLPDGTKVWLNAASSLTYSTVLNERGAVRMVMLSGEAYFEVFRNKSQPFVVKSKKMELTVLGTHFNVNAYEDEGSTKTTLLEGSVRVTNLSARQIVDRKSDIVTLLPSQQAVIDNPSTQPKESKIAVKSVDANEAIAWKNGEFLFNKEELGSIMKKLSRWYNVEIQYEDASLEGKAFWGTISKFSKVSDVLRMLELTGDVHFKIEGRRIIVKP